MGFENLLEKTRIDEAKYKTALTAWNTVVCGKENALNVLTNDIFMQIRTCTKIQSLNANQKELLLRIQV